MTQLFQVNLKGIIELLSNHLYSGPHVFVRELLQNAVDALTARARLDGVPAGEGAVRVSVRRGDGPPELVFEDDGVGLTEEEVHRFLATLGESSKRRLGGEADPDLIGQFGIGLLACFLVSDEIVVRTRSARSPDAVWIEWRGRQDGTYAVGPVDGAAPAGVAGTRVSLVARPDRLEWFEPARVRQLLEHFGALLRCPVRFSDGLTDVRVNHDSPPWRAELGSRRELDHAVLGYGRALFGVEFMDWIPLRASSSGASGVAFVLPYAPNLAEPRTSRVYLKGMLVSERSTEIVPPWAFFVHCVVDAERLRPTASREAFYEDELLETTREELGVCIRAWLMHAAEHEPGRLRALIAVHHLSIKALAAEDADVLALFADFLPFETTVGRLSFAEVRAHGGPVYFATSVDGFRQMAPVATAQGNLLVNAGYVYDADILVRACALHDLACAPLDSATLTEELDDLSPRDQDRTRAFVALAEGALKRFGLDVTIKEFRPEELPAFYASSRDAELRREIERTREKSTGIWADVLGSIAGAAPTSTRPLLCFNHKNPLVRRLASAGDDDAVQLAVELLYIHALLLSHQPLRASEQQLMPSAILGFIEWGLAGRSRGMLQ
jgi:molecular chaperone HtpG